MNASMQRSSSAGIQHVSMNARWPFTMWLSNQDSDEPYGACFTELTSSVPNLANGARLASASSCEPHHVGTRKITGAPSGPRLKPTWNDRSSGAEAAISAQRASTVLASEKG